MTVISNDYIVCPTEQTMQQNIDIVTKTNHMTKWIVNNAIICHRRYISIILVDLSPWCAHTTKPNKMWVWRCCFFCVITVMCWVYFNESKIKPNTTTNPIPCRNVSNSSKTNSEMYCTLLTISMFLYVLFSHLSSCYFYVGLNSQRSTSF